MGYRCLIRSEVRCRDSRWRHLIELRLNMGTFWLIFILLPAQTITEGKAQTCRSPQLASATKHNGTAVEYPPDAVLYYSCDSGYKLNYKSPTSRCTQSSGQSSDLSWDPPDIKCDIDVTSLAVSVVLSFVAIKAFLVTTAYLIKKRIHGDISSRSAPTTPTNRDEHGMGSVRGGGSQQTAVSVVNGGRRDRFEIDHGDNVTCPQEAPPTPGSGIPLPDHSSNIVIYHELLTQPRNPPHNYENIRRQHPLQY